jgi:Zn-dependent protease with chaperone function
MDFLNSGLGQYIIQTVFHSAIIALIVEAMLKIWHIQMPFSQIKFRLLVLALPICYLPLYFLLYPPRAGAHFREQVALIDLNEWLGLRLVGGLYAWHLFGALLALLTAYFLFKEAIPSLRHYLGRRHSSSHIESRRFPELDSILTNLSGVKGLPMPKVLLSAENTPVIHTMGSRVLILSAATINMLDNEELEAVVAHELAHLTKQARRINQISMALRFLMFYNPIALFIFRRIINDNEKNCDDIAASTTGKQLALASGLFKVFRQTATSPATTSDSRSWILPQVSALEYRAYRYLIKERIERLVHPDKVNDLLFPNFRALFMAGLLVALLFFVV